MLKAEHWTDGQPGESIRKCLARFTKSDGAGEFTIAYTNAAHKQYGLEEHFIASDHDFDSKDQIPAHGAITIHVGNPEWFFIGPKLGNIEQVMPGAGQTILHTLECAGRNSLGLLAPSDALDIARNLFWMGEDDERLAMEENDWEPGSILTRAQLMDEVPPWAYSPRPMEGWPKFTVNLQQGEFGFTLRQQEENIHRLLDRAAMVWKMSESVFTRVKNHAPQVAEHNFMSCPFLLRWNNSDSLTRLFDDCWNDIQQAGERTDLSFGTFFKWGDMPEMIKAWQNLEPVLVLVGEMAKLIAEIGEPDKGHNG